LLDLLALGLEPLLELLALRREALLDVLAARLDALLDLLAADAQLALHALELGAERAGSLADAVDAVLEQSGRRLGHEGSLVAATNGGGAGFWGWGVSDGSPPVEPGLGAGDSVVTRRNLTRCVNASRSAGRLFRFFSGQAPRSHAHERTGPREA